MRIYKKNGIATLRVKKGFTTTNWNTVQLFTVPSGFKPSIHTQTIVTAPRKSVDSNRDGEYVPIILGIDANGGVYINPTTYWFTDAYVYGDLVYSVMQ